MKKLVIFLLILIGVSGCNDSAKRDYYKSSNFNELQLYAFKDEKIEKCYWERYRQLEGERHSFFLPDKEISFLKGEIKLPEYDFQQIADSYTDWKKFYPEHNGYLFSSGSMREFCDKFENKDCIYSDNYTRKIINQSKYNWGIIVLDKKSKTIIFILQTL